MWRRTIKDSIGGDTIDMVPLVQPQQFNSMERPCYHHMCNNTQSGSTINPEVELNNCDGP